MVLGQSTELNAPSSLGSKTGEVEEQVWNTERYGKQWGTEWKYKGENLMTVVPKTLLDLY